MKTSLLLACLATINPYSIKLLNDFSFNDKVSNRAISSTPTVGTLITNNINLNDTPENEIRSYYSYLSSLSKDERRGTNLLKNLKPILQNMHYFDYSTVWKIYEITDRDYTLSPASGDSYGSTSYNSTTNYFTSYSYGSSTSEGRKGNNPYVRPLYRNRVSGSIIDSGRIREWDDHNVSGINREHVWPQSRGFKADSGASGPAGTDLHHLLPGDGYVNQSLHNNYPYGNVDKTKSTTHSDKDFLKGNYLGRSTFNPSSSNQVFEPQDEDKGDIARSIFYMAACYNNYSNETGVISAFNPNLTITNEIYDGGKRIESNDTTTASMGVLADLLEWHYLDPVDEYEIHRNNLIYENYQLNRNPFIDFPEWVDYIWGESSNTKYATPESDIINGYEITLSNEEVTIDLSSSNFLTARSVDISSKFVWDVIDDSVIQIVEINNTNGESTIRINPLKVGSTTIVVSQNGVETRCSVAVTSPDVLVSSITVLGEDRISLNAPTTYTANVFPENATNKSISWSVDNNSIASISNSGVLTPLREGTIRVIAQSLDGSNIEGYKTVTISNDETSKYIYKKITSNTDDFSGTYVLGYEEDETQVKIFSGVDANNGYIQTIKNNETILDSNDLVTLSILKTGSNYSIKVNSGTNANKYIGLDKENTNGLTFSDTPLINSIAYVNDDNDALKITSSIGAVFRFNAATNYLRFRYYKSTTYTGQKKINLYKKELSLSYFVESLLNDLVCDSSGLTPPDMASWAILMDLYEELSLESKTILKTTPGNQNGTLLEQAISKYDYILTKYGASYSNFLSRNININNSLEAKTSLNNIEVITFFALSVLTILFFLILKKKQTRKDR